MKTQKAFEKFCTKNKIRSRQLKEEYFPVFKAAWQARGDYDSKLCEINSKPDPAGGSSLCARTLSFMAQLFKLANNL